ncbi:hypothetical protein P7H22_11835 [Paenibacillus larvae]|nr:hypothetical protein [Paenibacillus larvae]MDT2240906.1 hypothetical protein [Paenibacillus larvae]
MWSQRGLDHQIKLKSAFRIAKANSIRLRGTGETRQTRTARTTSGCEGISGSCKPAGTPKPKRRKADDVNGNILWRRSEGIP